VSHNYYAGYHSTRAILAAEKAFSIACVTPSASIDAGHTNGASIPIRVDAPSAQLDDRLSFQHASERLCILAQHCFGAGFVPGFPNHLNGEIAIKTCLIQQTHRSGMVKYALA